MFNALRCKRMHPLSTLLKTLPASIASQSFLRPGIFAIMLGAITLFASSPSSGSTSVTDIDGNVYNTVTIGTQVWMKENLKVTKYRNGEVIGTTITTEFDFSGETSPKYQWGSEGGSYGRWYTWYAATDSRGVCPTGWHLPTDAEWTTLTNYLGGESVAGGKMKLTGTTYWYSPNTGADNSSGWSGLPGGYHYYNNSHFLDRQGGYWWSATGYDKTRAWFRALSSSFASVERVNQGKSLGYSVRCVNGDDVGVGKLGVVNTTGDESDANNSDGICDVDLNTEGEQCTLRAAIEEVNLSTDVNTISFDIPTTDPGYNAGTSTFTISPQKPLPMIEKSLVADGATQPVGKVVLNGSRAGEGSDGIYVSNGNLTLKNISISGFFGNGISNSVGDVRVENMDITDNGGYGIIADGDIYINSPASDIDTKKITVSGNGGKGDGGGIRSRNKSVTSNNVEIINNQGPGILAKKDISLKTVKSNNNKGPGIQSMDGNITIMSGKSDHSDDNEVSSNQGPGIISGVDVVIHGIGSGSTGIYEGGMIKIETDITVKGNAGWGIFSIKSVTLDRIDGVTSGVSPQSSEISGNGDKTKQFYMTDANGTLTLSLLNNVSFAGGIAGETVDASILEVTNNQGPGILARKDISLKTVKSNSNQGPGIQSMDGNITIMSGKSDHSDNNEVSSNQGPGIFSGVDMTANVYGKSIFIQTDIQVKGNSGWGIGAPKRDVVVNGIDYGTPGKVSSSSSYIVGNGTQNSPFYMVEDDGTLVQLNYNINSGGGILSGQMKGYLIEVTGNFGNGIQSESDLTLSDSYICDNAGMNLVVGGAKNLTNVTVCTPVISAATVSATNPVNNATNVAENTTVTATFSEPMLPSAINSTNFTVNGVTGTVAYDATNKIATFTPSSNLSYSTTYTATITTGVKDAAGNAMASDYTWSFTTAATRSYTSPTPTGTGTATATVSGGGATCSFTTARFILPTVTPPAGIVFPQGVFDFTLGGCTSSSTVTLNITYPSAVPAGAQYWKYGPTPTDASYHWYVLPATIAGNIVTFTIADGGLGDDDLTVNGIIVDQGGPGVPMAQATPTAIPTLSEWGVALLMCVLGLFGAGAVRRCSKVGM